MSSVGVKVIEFGNGVLNPLSVSTRQGIYKALKEVKEDEAVRSIILIGKGGKHFSAGADMTEFASLGSGNAQGEEEEVIGLLELVNYIEGYSKPIIAAIQGVALGGGLELAMACHYRVAHQQTSKLSLPEVQVGVIPGAGGTQRLPRLVGIEMALSMILKGKAVNAHTARANGLVDDTTTFSVLDLAMKWAQWAQESPPHALARASARTLPKQILQATCQAVQKSLPPAERGGEGVQAALQAVAASHDFEKGQEEETRLFYEMLASQQGRSRRHVFFATRMAQKPRYSVTTTRSVLLSPSPKVHVGVVGAGLMGSGIALVLLQANFSVRLFDISAPAIQNGKNFLSKTIGSMVQRGQVSVDKGKAMYQQQLSTTTNLDALADCHLVVEAIVENFEIKKKVFTRLDTILPPHALLLSNTSTLDIDALAAAAVSPQRRGNVAGWHFFSPAHKMKLVEIIETPNYTSRETIAILQALTKRVGKIGVVMGNCFGFVGNRMLQPYTSESVFCLSEGLVDRVETVDKALHGQFGMAMGIFQMSDLAGNDIGYLIRKERGMTRGDGGRVGPNRPARYTELADDLVTKLGRLGQKAGKGWYDYDPKINKGRTGIPSREVTDFVRRHFQPVVTPKQLTSDEIIEQCLFGLVNEGFKILEEGIIHRPSDIDVVYIYGYGWPVWRGGPMFWANYDVGLERVLEKLKELHAKYPGSDYLRPSKLLETCVAMNMTVDEYFKTKRKATKAQSKL